MALLAAGLGRQLPESMACLDAGFEAATKFYAFPKGNRLGNPAWRQ
jgi:hypothetical protein